MKAWWLGGELAGVPGMPSHPDVVTRWGHQGRIQRRKRPIGKGYEYALESLPAETQAHLRAINGEAPAATEPAEPTPTLVGTLEPGSAQPRRPKALDASRRKATVASADLWAWAEQQTDARRAVGAERAVLVREVAVLMANGATRDAAIATVSGATTDCPPTSLRRWYLTALRYNREDWAAALIPHARGRRSGDGRTAIHPDAWDWFRSQWLVRRRPTVAEVYRRLDEIAQARGWSPLPSLATFERRVGELPIHTTIYHREGAEALAKLIPRQRRDVRVYAAGEAVNGDGLKLDKLWVEWPDGEIISTSTVWPWQDLRTGRILAYRIAKTESTDLFRLATYDLLGVCLPKIAWLDNTRVAANIAMTGQAAGRHRFSGPKRAEDPLGILLQLGIEPHFTDPDKEHATPGSKRIERAFGIGGLHSEIAHHPRFRDRGWSKATAIPYQELAEVAAEEVGRFNARPGRRSPECNGVKSYDQLWAELTAEQTPRMATESQRRLLLLMVEACRADSASGEIKLKAGTSHLGAARYWADWMPSIAGQRVAAYYDPADLQRPITVYSLDGLRLGEAERQSDAGHNDTDAAGEARRIRIRQQKAWKKMANDDRRLDAIRAAELYGDGNDGAEVPAAGQVQPRVVEAHFGGARRVLEDGTLVDTSAAEQADAEPVDAEADEARFRAAVADMAAHRRKAQAI